MTAAHTLEQIRYLTRESLCATSTSAQIDADYLLCFVLNIARATLYSHPEMKVSQQQQQQLAALVARRQQGEPVAYLVGQQEFWSLMLNVNASVLIPRPATETLVEHCLNDLARESDASVLELGTGSGAIAIALASERPNLRIEALDVSHEAIALATKNAQTHNLHNIRFYQSNWFEQVTTTGFTLIASNPPYIAHDDLDLQPEVKKFEPTGALISANNGLQDLTVIATEARQFLQADGRLVLEHGWQQQQEVAQLMRTLGYHQIRCINDYQGLARVTSGVIKA